MGKLMVVIRDENFQLLSFEARDRGITIQELIRAVIVPDWFRIRDIPKVRSASNPLQEPPLRQQTDLPLPSPHEPFRKN